MTNAASPPQNTVRVFPRLLPYLRPHARTLAFGLACLLVATPAGAFHPLVWAFMVDVVIGRRRIDLLVPAAAVMLAVQAAGTALEAVRANLLEKVGQRIVFTLRNQVYEKLQGQSLSYLYDRPTGDLVARAVGDIDALQDVAIQGTDNVVANVLGFAWVAGVLLWLNWQLGLVTLLPIVAVFGLTRFFNARVRRVYREVRDRLGDVTARLQENLNGIVVIKAFSREPEESARFAEATGAHLRASFKAINARTAFFPAVRLVGFISNVLSVSFGAWLVLQGRFTVGGLVAYRGYWWPLFQPISSLATVNEMLQRAQAAGARVFELLDAPEPIADAPDAKDLVLTGGRVEFRDVRFCYRPEDGCADLERPLRPALDGVSFSVEPGELVALVGPSGAGKTTVLGLIPRFYDPQEGAVLVDGQDVRSVTQRSLRRHMAMVLQDTFLFDGTVRDNLRYGNPDASEQQVEEAARAANAEEFIQRLPQGYDTPIGERGVKLSGGQRQRLAIARAFLANPEILLLDEPTSSVEPESEAIITQALERLMRGRTTLVTSHRYSLVRGADRVLAFDRGKLVEQGPPDVLLASGGLYAEMVRQQVEGAPADHGAL